MSKTAQSPHAEPANHTQDFIDAMSKAGCAPHDNADITPDGEDHTIRAAGDRKDKRLAYCLTICPDGFAYGNFIFFKTGDKGSWHSGKGAKGLSKEERAANKERMERAEAEKEARRQEVYKQKAIEAKALWAASKPADPEHPYLKRKSIQPNGARQDGDDLIIQMVADGRICSYQRILADGSKYYMAGARKQAAYFPIANAGDDKRVMVLVEGFATGCSVREATNLPIIVCFDAGNLMSVALEIRKKYPTSTLLIAADNDHDGETNTGRVKGEAAAMKVDGFCIWPEFADGDAGSDFNDLHASQGLEAVKTRILAATAAREGASGVTTPLESGLQPTGADSINEGIPPPSEYEDRGGPTIDENGDINLTGDMGLPFRILGYNDEMFYYFPFGMQQIIKWSAASHTINNFIQLASLQEWKDWALRASEERMTPKEIPLYAFNEMKRVSVSRGVFQEEDRVRGCGVWMDVDRVVLHCGDKLLVDGVLTPPKNMTSHYVYAAAAQRFKHHASPLSNQEAQKLREICTMPTWENPLSGLLLAGWLVIAPVCAALEWRPHIWLTGESGAGKSTLLNQIIKKVLVNISYNADGGTTESSIREGLGYDARPVIYDEAEGKGNKFSLMDGVLALAKLSSSGGNVGKRGQKRLTFRSSFCFSAINPPIKDFASETRISLLNLKRNTAINSEKHYDALVDAINSTLTPDYGRRMLARTVMHMPNLLTNIKTFKRAATVVIKNARAADQVSAMLGGLYMLGSTGLITDEEAQKWIAERDWTEHTAISQVGDPERLLHHIGTSVVKVSGGTSNRECTIGTLISCALGRESEVGVDVAKSTLKQYSISVKTDGVIIGNDNKNMARILGDTDWAINWNKTLSRIPGTIKISKHYFGSTDNQRSIKLPAKLFYEDEAAPETHQEEMEIAFD